MMDTLPHFPIRQHHPDLIGDWLSSVALSRGVWNLKKILSVLVLLSMIGGFSLGAIFAVAYAVPVFIPTNLTWR